MSCPEIILHPFILQSTAIDILKYNQCSLQYSMTFYLKIPQERVAVLIGQKGRVRASIERQTGVRLRIDSRDGGVEIDDTDAKDPFLALRARDIVRAIGRGFSPKTAFSLLQEDYYMEILDIRDYAGKRKNHVRRLRARVIGSNGKTRKSIEENANVSLSVYGNTVSIIGPLLELTVAKNAVDMLLSGSEHSTVYRYLERKRKDIKLAEYGLESVIY